MVDKTDTDNILKTVLVSDARYMMSKIKDNLKDKIMQYQPETIIPVSQRVTICHMDDPNAPKPREVRRMGNIENSKIDGPNKMTTFRYQSIRLSGKNKMKFKFEDSPKHSKKKNTFMSFTDTMNSVNISQE